MAQSIDGGHPPHAIGREDVTPLADVQITGHGRGLFVTIGDEVMGVLVVGQVLSDIIILSGRRIASPFLLLKGGPLPQDNVTENVGGCVVAKGVQQGSFRRCPWLWAY